VPAHRAAEAERRRRVPASLAVAAAGARFWNLHAAAETKRFFLAQHHFFELQIPLSVI
jgi:hypothetical protein